MYKGKMKSEEDVICEKNEETDNNHDAFKEVWMNNGL